MKKKVVAVSSKEVKKRKKGYHKKSKQLNEKETGTYGSMHFSFFSHRMRKFRK